MSHFYTHSHYHFLRMKEMGRIYWCHSIGALGVSLAAIFIPIYLLKIDFSLKEILVFLVLQQLFSAALAYPVGKLMQYIKPHYMMAIGSGWYIVLFCLLTSMDRYGWSLAFLAFIWALNRVFYWLAFHYTFASARQHKNSGNQIASLSSLVIIATSIAPAVGGIVATIFGINYVYWAAILILIIACLPVLVSNEGPNAPRMQITKFSISKMRRDFAANFFNGMALMTEQSLWPIFIFLIVTSYAGIGLLSSVIALAGILAAFYAGRNEKNKGEHHFINQGALAYSITSLGRGLAQSTGHIFGLNLLAGLGRSLYLTPFLNRYYTNSDKDNRLGYIVMMEIAFAAGGTLFLGGLLLLTFLLPIKTVLVAGFAAAAVFITGARLIR